jgi:HD superfamily phosphohydrolase
MLYSYIYHHQKVRICELVFKYILYLIHKYCNNPEETNAIIKLKHPCDFLNYTDSDFWNRTTIDKMLPIEAREILKKIIYRDIPKRALRISQLYIKDNKRRDVKDGFDKFYKIKDNWPELLKLSREIFDKIPHEERGNLISENIWIDIPKYPPIDEAKKTDIPILSKNGTLFRPLEDFFPIEKWVEGYKDSKWKAHIYTIDDYKDVVRTAARQVLKEKYNISLTNLADF